MSDAPAIPSDMSPDQLKAARKRLGMSQDDMARALRLGRDGARTVRRWETEEGKPGHRGIPGPVEVLIETWLGFPVEELEIEL